MTSFRFTIELTSDAEPGTGIGGEHVNEHVPRDHRGRPVLRASHLKGLLRELVSDMASWQGWDLARVLEGPFGRPGRAGDPGTAGTFALSDAVAVGEVAVRLVSRTALSALSGTAAGQTLRTVESIPRGTKFEGSVVLEGNDPVAETVLRVALLALPSVGGGRTRGSGACVVTIDGETRAPSTLLEALRVALAAAPPERARAVAPLDPHEADEIVFLRLVFRAATPVCCPERPAVESNLMRSGLAIPASAVQGMLLTRASRLDPALADALFDCPTFRAWPLLPAGDADADALPEIAVRVSRSHRMSKLAGAGGEHEFRDAVIEPYDWRDVASGSPLKATDGVLLRGRVGDIALWSGGDIPRTLTAHAVHTDPSGERERNLFTVESLAPQTFLGLVCGPRVWLQRLAASLRAEPHVALGKARTVRGQGALVCEEVDATAWTRGPDGTPASRYWVLQSPALLDGAASDDPRAAIAALVSRTGHGQVLHSVGAVGVRFGWSLAAKSGSTHRIAADRVLLPGSVIELESAPADPLGALVRGLGEGRQRGFGAWLPHPGIATRRHRPGLSIPTIASRDADCTRKAFELLESAGASGPSASQIGRLMGRVAAGDAKGWLDRQERERPARFAARWSGVSKQLAEVLANANAQSVLRTLRVWQDLLISSAERNSR